MPLVSSLSINYVPFVDSNLGTDTNDEILQELEEVTFDSLHRGDNFF